MKIYLLAICLPLASAAQTVTIQKVQAATEPQNGMRSVFVDASIANEKQVPVALDTSFFYLSTSDYKNSFALSSPAAGANPPTAVHLAPGNSVSPELSFAIPAEIEITTLRLCYHAFQSKNWDDYLEIPIDVRTPATAPMWHPARAGEPADDKTFILSVRDANLTPPKIVKAPDPNFPPGEQEFLRANRGSIVCKVSLIIDRTGRPQQIQIVQSSGSVFDEEALKAVQKYRFQPAKDANGTTVAVRVQVETRFRSN